MKLNKIDQQAMVTECRSSGMKANAWCETKGIEYRRYLTWATKFNRECQHELQQWVHVMIE